MINPELLFIEDFLELQRPLYRSGNASSPNFSATRALRDILVFERNGIPYVKADGNGFSTFDHVTTGMKQLGRNVWKIRKGSALPAELRIVQDRTPGKKGHYMIAPLNDMPLMKYLGLLQELAADMTKCVKLTPQEIQNA